MKFNLRRQSLLLIGLVLVIMFALSALGILDTLELNAVNAAFQLRGKQTPTSPIVIVAIDDNTFAINNLQWPWPRTYFAQIVDKLAAAGAKAIAFDVFFFERENAGVPATYTVQGESLQDIAAAYNVSVADIINRNGLDNTGKICGGQTLIIPSSPEQKHTVQRDTLDAIAARYNVDVKLLMKPNRIEDVCEIRPSQLLLIPVLGPVAYTVQAGQTVAEIAASFQVNALALLDAEGKVASDPLTAGQIVTVQFGDAALAASIKAAGNVIMNGEKVKRVEKEFTSETLNQPLPEFRENLAGFGITNFQRDVDGAVHSVQAWNTHEGVAYFSWPIIVAARVKGATLSAPTISGFTLNDQRVPLEVSFLRINYRGPGETIPTFGALGVVNGDLPLSTFKDKVIFIGATTASLQDIYPTPFDLRVPTPGVEIMANAFETVMTGDFLTVASGVCVSSETCTLVQRGVALLSIILAGVLGFALIQVRQPLLAIGALIGLLVLIIVAWLVAFLNFKTEIPVVAPILTLLVAFAVPAVERAVSEEVEKRRVRGIFEMFISPEMVGQLIDQGVDAMRGKRTELTVLFSDIRGFTSMSEQMTPEQLVEVLNEYLGAMTDVIHKHGGTVDKYEGDLVMAFFGAPVWYADHAERAMRAGIDMRLELQRLREKWATENKPSRLEMGIGLNSAEVFVGLIGSGRRVNYTVMGDGVNLASRIQDLTKDLKWPFIVSEFTYEKVKDKFECEFAEARLVKGKTVPVGMYKVFKEIGDSDERRVKPLFT